MHSQRWNGVAAIAVFANCALANPLRYYSLQGNASVDINHLTGRVEEFDPSGLSFITKMAAIGDSYSAGIGAGNVLETEAGEYYYHLLLS
jgi:hypothetical protein